MNAVNTIIVDNNGRLIGHNTDGIGFIADLADHHIDPRGLRTLILGAGGSARAIAHALLAHGCKSIAIANRTSAKADQLVSTLRIVDPDASIITGPLAAKFIKQLPTCDLVINTTSIGMAATIDQMPWDRTLPFSRGQIVYDLIYRPKDTAFLRHAALGGALCINGLGMLVHQGAAAFAMWTGREAPVAIMRAAALEAEKIGFSFFGF
jgi:shikimate dehydrogenase